jgi:hypothetical protein
MKKNMYYNAQNNVKITKANTVMALAFADYLIFSTISFTVL